MLLLALSTVRPGGAANGRLLPVVVVLVEFGLGNGRGGGGEGKGRGRGGGGEGREGIGKAWSQLLKKPHMYYCCCYGFT